MAPPKRKAPKGKSRRKPQPGLATRGAAAVGTLGLRGAGALGTVSLRGAGMLGGAVGRHPSLAGGAMAFAIVFSFVATNALWYQPGVHPSPLFRTRDPSAPYAIFGRKSFFQHDGAAVTTFRIERPDDQPAKTTAPATVAAAIEAAAAAPSTGSSAPAVTPPQGNLVAQVQTALAHRGLYQGAADGVMGPRTVAAISSYQQSAGLKQTGEASPELLTVLQSGTRPTAALPAERPADVNSKAAAIDPVAAAIMSADKSDKDVKTASVVPARKPATPAPAAGDPIANINMVMQIQKGLTNIAYSNVTIDGVAGDTTRQAILHFQKHYRLPETGVPDMTVLKKLKDIGAL